MPNSPAMFPLSSRCQMGDGVDYKIVGDGDREPPDKDIQIWPVLEITIRNLGDPSKTADFNLTGTSQVTYASEGNQHWG